MPAAKNTNNFWNLGGKNRGLSRVHATRTGDFSPQVTQILKEEGINAHEFTPSAQFGGIRAVVSQTLLSATLAYSAACRAGVPRLRDGSGYFGGRSVTFGPIPSLRVATRD